VFSAPLLLLRGKKAAAKDLACFVEDLNGDAREDVTFKVQFGAPNHTNGTEHQHVQTSEVRHGTEQAALKGADGELVISGITGQLVKSNSGYLAYAGPVPDLFAGDAAALTAFRKAPWGENRFYPEAFQNRKNFFGQENFTAIVIEVPSQLIGRGLVHAWATASLYGHAPEVQVSRWGLPLITHIFLSDPSKKEGLEKYNRAVPGDDVEFFSKPMGDFIEKVTGLANSSVDPSEYAKQVLARICPTVLPYELDTQACFGFGGFNGRALSDDVHGCDLDPGFEHGVG
jgi:hypothetical protein